MTEEQKLSREDLERICAEQGWPVAPGEWDKGLEHGLRVAFDDADDDIHRLTARLEAATAALEHLLWLLRRNMERAVCQACGRDLMLATHKSDCTYTAACRVLAEQS